MRPLRVAVVCAVLAALASGPAHATQPWPQDTIRYVNDAKPWAWSVRRAVAEWNRLDVGVRFLPARTRGEADLVISVDPRLPVPGRSTVGWYPFPGFVARLYLAAPSRGPTGPGIGDRYAMARVAAHELGHVLGLRHVERCALMYHTVDLRTGTELTCPPPDPGTWRCRIFERSDLRQVQRLYGVRRQVRRGPEECPRGSVPARATAASATLAAPEAPSPVTVRWRNPASEGFSAVLVNRRAGVCPERPNDPAARVVLDRGLGLRFEAGPRPRRVESTVDRSIEGPGRYCYAVWTGDAAGRFARRPTVALVTVPGVPAATVGPPPVQALRATVAHRRGLPIVTLRWQMPYGVGVEGLVVARAPTCAPDSPLYAQWELDARPPGSAMRFEDEIGATGPNDHVCYHVWTTGPDGLAPWPATARVAAVSKQPFVSPG